MRRRFLLAISAVLPLAVSGLLVGTGSPVLAASSPSNRAFCTALSHANAVARGVNIPDGASFQTLLADLKTILDPVEHAASIAPAGDPAVKRFGQNIHKLFSSLPKKPPSRKVSLNSALGQELVNGFSKLWTDVNPIHAEVLAACGSSIANAFDPGFP